MPDVQGTGCWLYQALTACLSCVEMYEIIIKHDTHFFNAPHLAASPPSKGSRVTNLTKSTV